MTQTDSAVHGLLTIFAEHSGLPHLASRRKWNEGFAGQRVHRDVVGEVGVGKKAAELDDVHAAAVTQSDCKGADDARRVQEAIDDALDLIVGVRGEVLEMWAAKEVVGGMVEA